MQMRVHRVMQVGADVFACVYVCGMTKGPTALLNLSSIITHGLVLAKLWQCRGWRRELVGSLLSNTISVQIMNDKWCVPSAPTSKETHSNEVVRAMNASQTKPQNPVKMKNSYY